MCNSTVVRQPGKTWFGVMSCGRGESNILVSMEAWIRQKEVNPAAAVECDVQEFKNLQAMLQTRLSKIQEAADAAKAAEAKRALEKSEQEAKEAEKAEQSRLDKLRLQQCGVKAEPDEQQQSRQSQDTAEHEPGEDVHGAEQARQEEGNVILHVQSLANQEREKAEALIREMAEMKAAKAADRAEDDDPVEESLCALQIEKQVAMEVAETIFVSTAGLPKPVADCPWRPCFLSVVELDMSIDYSCC